MALGVLFATACGGASAPAPPPAEAEEVAAPPEIILHTTTGRPPAPTTRLLDPREVVPPFEVTSMDGTAIASRDLVGRSPFVVFYFATWCTWCDRKMGMVRDALAAHDVEVIGVSVDDEETIDRVPAYLKGHGFDYPVVLATENPAFARAYNPMGGVPFLLVVGADGMLVHGQAGYDPTDGERLSLAVQSALGSD